MGHGFPTDRKPMQRAIGTHSVSVLLLSVFLAACSKSDVSGTYVASDDTSALLLQLVQTPDSRITGQITIVGIEATGRMQTRSSSLTGAASRTTINLSASPFGQPLSGTVEYNGHIDLTIPEADGRITTVSLSPGNASEFQSKTDQIRKRSEELSRAHAIAEQKAKAAREAIERQADEERERKYEEKDAKDLIGALEQTVASMQKSDAAGEYLMRIEKLEKGYANVTAKMNTGLDRQRELARASDKARVMSSMNEVIGFLNQGISSTNELRVTAGSLKSAFASKMATVGNEVSRLQQNCATVQKRALLTSATRLRLASVCSEFNDTYKQYGDQFHPVADGLARLDATYEREAQNQKQILVEAVRLQKST